MYESEILDVYKRCDVRSFPIDCRKIIRRLGYSLVSYGELASDHAEYKRLCLYSNDAFTVYDDRMVCYNHKANRRRIRFSLMHECGHIVLGTKDEDKADDFAANILAPPAIILDRDIIGADRVSRYFDVSVAAANHAVINTRGYDRSAGDRIAAYFRSFLREPDFLSVPVKPVIRKGRRTKRERLFDKREAWLAENYPGFGGMAFTERDLEAFFPFG